MIDWTHFAPVLSAIGAGFVAFAAVWKFAATKVVRPFARWLRQLNAAILELRPNGGQSIMDRIARIDASTQIASARVLTIMDGDAAPYYECDPSGLCTYANVALCDLFGLPKEDMTGKGWLEALHPADREPALDAWMSSVAKGIPFERDYRIRRGGNHPPHSGGIVTVRTVAHPMLGAQDQVIGFAGRVTLLE